MTTVHDHGMKTAFAYGDQIKEGGSSACADWRTWYLSRVAIIQPVTRVPDNTDNYEILRPLNGPLLYNP